MPVALPRMTLNHRILRIERPREKDGVDALNDVLHRDLRAHFRADSEFEIDERVHQAEVTGEFLIPARDPNTGEVLDVQGGDVIVYLDYRDVEQESEIKEALPMYVMHTLSHLRVLIGRL